MTTSDEKPADRQLTIHIVAPGGESIDLVAPAGWTRERDLVLGARMNVLISNFYGAAFRDGRELGVPAPEQELDFNVRAGQGEVLFTSPTGFICGVRMPERDWTPEIADNARQMLTDLIVWTYGVGVSAGARSRKGAHAGHGGGA